MQTSDGHRPRSGSRKVVGEDSDPAEAKTVTAGGSAGSSATLVAQDKHLLKGMLCTSTFGKEVKIYF